MFELRPSLYSTQKPAVWHLLLALCLTESAWSCCAVSTQGAPVVNADQTVIMIWDREKQTQHFVRKASFQSEGDSVGFIVPTPSRPQLEEAGDSAFPYLAQITAPKTSRGSAMPLSCAANSSASYAGGVTVIEEKTVAGYHAVVLAADSGKALLAWLQDHGYAFTPEVAAWAQPYLEQRWYMTAMKIAKAKTDPSDPTVAASALRITFKTDRPLFPYREPDSRKDAAALKTSDRLLRIYFLAESRYAGQFSSAQTWGSTTRWSQPLTQAQRSSLLQHLGLPESTGPFRYWLTEFEEKWPYGKAPGDVYFSESADQAKVAKSWPVPLDPTMALGLVLIFSAMVEAFSEEVRGWEDRHREVGMGPLQVNGSPCHSNYWPLGASRRRLDRHSPFDGLRDDGAA